MSFEEITIGLPEPHPLALPGVALFLDLDGTLASIVARPQDVGPDARRTQLLEGLQARLDGRLAIVSGRTLADIDRILEGRIAAVAAVHGLVRRDAEGGVVATAAHSSLPHAVAMLAEFAMRDPGLIIECKGLSATLHYRQAPDHAKAARRYAEALAAETGLTLQHGDMVEELRTPGPTKADSVRAFMTEAPFKGARPVFVGDDETDEHGFAAAAELGGQGVLVGSRAGSAASARLPDVAAVLAWLEAAA